VFPVRALTGVGPGPANWADIVRRGRFDSWLSGNLEDGGVDPVVTGQLGSEHPLARHLGDFLTDLSNANASGQTVRAYRCDLIQLAGHHDGEIDALTAKPVRAYLAEIDGLAPSSRKRKRAAVASFASGRCATTCSTRTRWTRSTRSRCRRTCPGPPRPPTWRRCSG
jgi:hypothetical protein